MGVARRSAPDEEAKLRVPRTRAREILNRHIDEGKSLQTEAGNVHDDESTFIAWRHKKQRWVKLTSQALKAAYTTPEPAIEFEASADPPAYIAADPAMEWELPEVASGINVLVSLSERLEYVDAPTEDAASELPDPEQTAPATVFLVHGRDEERKLQVARLLERTGSHEVVILHEQRDRGQTLIEKFEQHGGRSRYAVVLLTGDDLGGLAPADSSEEPALAPRARQNVIFELGFFVGRVGRGNVTVLYDSGVEIPTDYAGVVYTELDPGGAWEAKLLLELRGAGLTYDLNKLT